MPIAEEIIDTIDTFETQPICELLTLFKEESSSSGLNILNNTNSVGIATQEIMELLHEHIDLTYYMTSSSRQ